MKHQDNMSHFIVVCCISRRSYGKGEFLLDVDESVAFSNELPRPFIVTYKDLTDDTERRL